MQHDLNCLGPNGVHLTFVVSFNFRLLVKIEVALDLDKVSSLHDLPDNAKYFTVMKMWKIMEEVLGRMVLVGRCELGSFPIIWFDEHAHYATMPLC